MSNMTQEFNAGDILLDGIGREVEIVDFDSTYGSYRVRWIGKDGFFMYSWYLPDELKQKPAQPAFHPVCTCGARSIGVNSHMYYCDTNPDAPPPINRTLERLF